MAGSQSGFNIGIGLFADGFLKGINKSIGGLKKFTGAMSTTAKVVSGLGLAIGVVTAIHVRNSIQEFIKFEQQLAGLAKVMNDFDAARGVAAAIGELSTQMPVASERMFEVAESAARLGIRGVKNITEFTRVASMLGVATDLAADQAADAFARILKQTNTPISQFETLGSVINELSNNMATTTSEIVESIRRSAPELARLGLSANEIAVLSASLNEVSESASRAGTRLRRLAQDLGDPRKVDAFAKAIGRTPDEFAKILRQDPVSTIQEIIQVFGEGGAAAQELSTQIDSRVRLSLAALSQNVEGTTLGLRLMKEQIAGPDSLTKEYNVFASTTASAMQTVQNQIDELQRRTGEHVISIKKWVTELKALGLDFLLGEPDRLVGFGIDQDEFLLSLRQALAQGRGIIETELATITGGALFSDVEGLDDEAIKVIREMAAGLGDLEFTGKETAEVLKTDLVEAIQRVREEGGSMADAVAETVAELQNAIDESRAFESVGSDAGRSVQTFLSSALARLREMRDEGLPEEEIVAFRIAALQAGRAMRGVAEEQEEMARFDEDAQKMLFTLQDQVIALRDGERAVLARNDAFINASPEMQGKLLAQFDILERTKKMIEDISEQEQIRARISDVADRIALFDAQEGSARRVLGHKQEIRDIEIEMQLIRSRAAQLREGEARDEALRRANLLEAEISLRRQLFWKEEIARLEQEEFDKIMAEYNLRNKKQDELNQKIDEMRLLTKEAQFDFITRSLERMGDAAVDAFNKIIEGSGGAGEAVVTMLREIANELLRRQIVGFLLGLMNFAKPGGGSEVGAPGGFISGDRSFGEGVRLGPMARADGGPLNANQLALVGEEGPELFVPRVRGNVVSNDDLKNVSGGDTYNVSHQFTINAMDGESVRRVLAKEKKFITGMTVEGISRSRALKRSGLN